jgi:hypothetical protein
MMFAEMQLSIAVPAIKPESVCGVAIAETHGYQADGGSAAVPNQQLAGHEVARSADSARPHRIMMTVVARRHEPGRTGPAKVCELASRIAASALKPTPQARFDSFVMVCLRRSSLWIRSDYLKLFICKIYHLDT